MYRILHQSILRVTTNESAKAIVKVLVAAYTCWATFNYATRGWGFLIFKFFKHEQAQVLMSLSTDTFQLFYQLIQLMVLYAISIFFFC